MDPQALENFMRGKGVVVQNNVMNINLPIPEEYRDAFKKWMGGDLMEGTVTDVPALSPTSETEEAPVWEPLFKLIRATDQKG
jgi:hypothetical protein